MNIQLDEESVSRIIKNVILVNLEECAFLLIHVSAMIISII